MDKLIIKSIGDRHGLHIDQLGILEEEIGLVMSGKGPADDFVSNIENRLDISTQHAIDLATDVNVEIFIPARQSTFNKRSDPEKGISREDILSEIENPTPVAHPISTFDQTPAGPAVPREIISEKNSTPDDTAHEFIGGKLTEPVSLPTKKASVDPYREPIE